MGIIVGFGFLLLALVVYVVATLVVSSIMAEIERE